MTKFFFELTMQNWGFPWHIFLAIIATHIFFWLFYWWLYINKNREFLFPWYSVLTWFSVNFIGYLNEAIQQDKAEFWQDTIANNIGIVIGLILIYIGKGLFEDA